ncbi:MAG: DUF4922 domain-containing protein [Bacteroidetes bacterium]|nr:DUF4922 domain-containing protein [Bacteroidota bacterium]
MTSKNVVKDNELKKYGSVENFGERTRALFNYQFEKWPLLKERHNNLNILESRELKINNTSLLLKFNPQKAVASTSNLNNGLNDTKICSFCSINSSDNQKLLQYGNDFYIHVNPFPDLEEHLIIAKFKHVSQRIKKNFEDLLNLSRDLGKFFTIYYNGPDCGPPSTDHLHFYGCRKNIFPLEKEYSLLKESLCRLAGRNGKAEVWASKNFSRKFIVLESTSKIELLNIFKIFFDGFLRISGDSVEPGMNIIASFNLNKWTVFIFPRRQYNSELIKKEGVEQLLISPSALEFGGICFTGRKDDLESADQETLESIFNNISVSTEFFEFLINRCETYFR